MINKKKDSLVVFIYTIIWLLKPISYQEMVTRRFTRLERAPILVNAFSNRTKINQLDNDKKRILAFGKYSLESGAWYIRFYSNRFNKFIIL